MREGGMEGGGYRGGIEGVVEELWRYEGGREL